MAKTDDRMARTPAMTAEEQAVWRAYLRASALLREALNRDIEAQSGMSLNEYEVLARLADSPEGAVRMAALADELVHSRSRLTHTVHRMEARGLVERRACQADGRGVYCALTELGRRTFDAAEPGHLASVRAYLLDVASPVELEALGALMERIATGIAGDAAVRAGLTAERVG